MGCIRYKVGCRMSVSGSPVKSFTKGKSFSRRLQANRNLLGKSFTICTIDAECCAIVVQRYGGAMFVVQTILWCGMGVVYGVYLVKSGVYLTIPYLNRELLNARPQNY